MGTVRLQTLPVLGTAAACAGGLRAAEPHVPSQYATIQAAIGAADPNTGDEVVTKKLCQNSCGTGLQPMVSGSLPDIG